MQWINTVGDPKVQIDEFIEYWYAVHTLDAEHTMRKRQKVENAVKIYRKYKAPLSMLLEQYAQANHFTPKELRRANPWEYAQKNLQTVVQESGMAVDEKLFNEAAYLISREAPTEVIHSVFFKNRDDSPMESALLQSEIRRLMPQSHNILIVNPSASFLDEFESRFENYGLKSNESAKRNIVFAVRDDIVAFLYAKQFPHYHIIRIDDLSQEQSGYDLVVVLARDNELPPLWQSLPLCTEYGSVILFVPQTTLTDNDAKLYHMMQQNQIYADWILDVPTSLTKSEPRKKLVMLARRGKVFEGRKINLLQASVSLNKNCFTLSKEQVAIPAEALNRGLTIVKLRQLAKELKHTGVLKPSKECQIYDFSEEIKICFYWVKVKGKLDRARAYYRNIYRPKEDAERIKGKRPNDIKTEKGLRGKTEAEILVKLEQVAMYDEYYDLIVDDIKNYYSEDYSRLTLKTMWFCCRSELLTKISYDDSVAKELFCGLNQNLSCLISGDCKPDDIAAALESFYGENGAGKKIWIQLNMIYQTAVEQGLLAKNPLATMLHVIREAYREKLSQLNSALKRSSFLDDEESRMVEFMRENVPVKGRKGLCAPRYVAESKWLVGAFSLFSGIPIREICPLRWGDLSHIGNLEEMKLSITKHLNSKEEIISNVNYGNKVHFRKIAVDLILSRMLMDRKEFLINHCGYTEESLATLPILLECEPIGRGKKNLKMVTVDTARKVNRKLLEEAKIPQEIISLLDGEARFDVDLNSYRTDLFAANYRYKVYHNCGFTVGELCHSVGNKSVDTFDRHYCDYSNDFLLYDMIHKMYRWTYVYDEENQIKKKYRINEFITSEQMYKTGRFEKGLAETQLNLVPDECADDYIIVEILCEHGLDGKIVGFEKEGGE